MNSQIGYTINNSTRLKRVKTNKQTNKNFFTIRNSLKNLHFMNAYRQHTYTHTHTEEKNKDHTNTEHMGTPKKKNKCSNAT